MTIDERDVRERFAALTAAVSFRADPARLLAEAKRLARRQRRRRVVIGSASGGVLAIALTVLVPLALQTLPSGDGLRVVHGGPSTSAPAGAEHVAPLADVAATPHGWAPVAYRGGQISVPSRWFVENSGTVCGAHDAGRVFVARSTQLPADMGCGRSDAVVTLRVAGTTALPHAKAEHVNGIAVDVGWKRHAGTTTWLERGLGLDVTATGTRARQVLRTLTHSPLSVVLRSSGLHTPADWRHLTFGGLRFAVPAEWRIRRSTAWGDNCNGLPSRVVELNTARTFAALMCPLPPSEAGPQQGRPGLLVGAGPRVDSHRGVRDCAAKGSLRICLQRGSQILTAFIHEPGRARAVEVQLGLFGSGLTSAQIFDSIEPAG